MSLSRQTAYAFLLGELSDEAAEAVEADVFTDDAEHEALGAFEAELVDASRPATPAPRRAATGSRWPGPSTRGPRPARRGPRPRRGGGEGRAG